MEEKEESRSTVAPKSDEAFAPIPFHHPSDKYRKVAPIAAVVVAVGAFFLSMVGDGEPNYDIMTAGAFGCCSLLNVAFISQAIYQRNLIQHRDSWRRKDWFATRVYRSSSVGFLWHGDSLGKPLLELLRSYPSFVACDSKPMSSERSSLDMTIIYA